MSPRIWIGLLACALASACTSEVGEAFECESVCDAYSDCVGDDVSDQSVCADQCRAFADRSDASEDRVFACDDCMDANEDACDARCNDVCAGILPPL